MARLLSPFLLVACLGALAAPAVAGAAVVDRSATIRTAGLGEFDQLNASRGDLRPSKARAYEGKWSARASILGGGNGFSRGIFNVDWDDGDDVSYGAAFYLPRGFRAAMQGQVDLLRWDNWATDPDTTDRSGIVIYRSDRKARLVRQKLGIEQEAITPRFTLPEGRWFHLEVRQRLSRRSGAVNEVYIDGRRVTRSRKANTYGRGVDRLRAGIVATDENRQRRSLRLWFDRVTVRRGRPVGVPARRR